MKILLAVHQFPPSSFSDSQETFSIKEIGGVGLLTKHLALELGFRGHDVTLLIGSINPSLKQAKFEYGPVLEKNIQLICLSIPMNHHGLLQTLFPRGLNPLLKSLLQDIRPDILHIQHLLNLSPKLARLGKSVGAKIISSIHDYWPICQKIFLTKPDGHECQGPFGGVRCAFCISRGDALWDKVWQLSQGGARLLPYILRTLIMQGAYANSDGIICPSSRVAEIFINAGFKKKHIAIVDYGTMPIPKQVVLTQRPRKPIRFGYLGTLGSHKGLEVLIHALEKSINHPWKILIYGGPIRDPKIKNAIDRLMSLGHLDYRGEYDEHELPQILSELDAIIIPTLTGDPEKA